VQRIEPLALSQQATVKQLFLVGGYSSSSLKATEEESRRIELRIEFYEAEETLVPAPATTGDAARCNIGAR
jgi:hypothetical protein